VLKNEPGLVALTTVQHYGADCDVGLQRTAEPSVESGETSHAPLPTLLFGAAFDGDPIGVSL